MTTPSTPGESDPLSKADFEALARFRFGIRRYLRISEEIVRAHGVTPQQYQLMLALMGFPGREWATVQELTDLIQLRHHSVVELIDRAQKHGLVRREAHPSDARAVRVSLTSAGEQTMGQLGALHRGELHRLGAVLSQPFWVEFPAPSGGADPDGTAADSPASPGPVGVEAVRRRPRRRRSSRNASEPDNRST